MGWTDNIDDQKYTQQIHSGSLNRLDKREPFG